MYDVSRRLLVKRLLQNDWILASNCGEFKGVENDMLCEHIISITVYTYSTIHRQ
jgi:hypothetical protein